MHIGFNHHFVAFAESFLNSRLNVFFGLHLGNTKAGSSGIWLDEARETYFIDYLFIKPNAGGSSFGVTKVKTKEDIQPAIEKAFGESDEVIIEAFMQGTEITCGCYKTKDKEVVFPITEVVTSNEFFDYDAKYNGQVDEITPARIPEETAERVRLLTSAIYDILGCDGIIRIDYIITEGEKVNLLEINTTPGMTATSFIPQQVRAAGLDIKDVMTEIIENKFN